MEFEDFIQGADFLMALRNYSLSEIKQLTFDEFLIATDTMFDNQRTVVRWLGRFI